ncbi:hypothetical protein DFO77_102105 [Marinilabilia salmonicolor]|uniref:Uncharacterized protein n=1 Tax=Marinilabilia salmonicolor TaxID=989 RepID=A0A368VIW5_9BACT|nr:hypothetical protein DFO77_102105 [Marinilabilia salmonicolor]
MFYNSIHWCPVNRWTLLHYVRNDGPLPSLLKNFYVLFLSLNLLILIFKTAKSMLIKGLIILKKAYGR